jgi:phenylpropionate dioxygenase-like ring-hydroxylating dioxygenase large terminal subunit
VNTLKELVEAYERDRPLAEASTIPSGWYTDPRIFELERQTVFARSWHFACRVDQVAAAGQFVSLELAGEPLVIVRGQDERLRGFFNVCRHHAAAVVTAEEGAASTLRCPYHGWTYGLDGALKGTPDFNGVCNFDRPSNGLVPVATAIHEPWVLVRLDRSGVSLVEYLGPDLAGRLARLDLQRLTWVERRHYTLACNWKVFVDNYLDGGYHVPHLHKGLDSVLDYSQYTIENGERFCLQSSPLVNGAAEPQTGAVRRGERASYLWLHPNFMINVYGDAMDTNLVIPRGIDRTEVVFDFYFADVSSGARQRHLASIGVSEQIQDEDVAICESVQRGLGSRAYSTGRLSVRREAGIHLFHQLLHDDLVAGLK